jgi:hypothetical protein
MSALYVTLGLLVLYLSHWKMTVELSRLIHRLGGNQNLLIWVWSVIFLPGTIIHEISHFLAAAATGTRTGNIEIFPEFIEEILDEEEDKKGVTLGYVQVARMNPVQGFFVGMAPFISGMALMIWLASLIYANYLTQNIWPLILQVYLFFVIGNSFFPSWSDIKQTIPLIIISLIFVFLAWFFGFQLLVEPTSPVWKILDSMLGALVISIVINLCLVGALVLINRRRRR